MGLVAPVLMVVLGILGAASLIIARKPDARELIDKLAPYQGYMGAVGAIWGVWVIIHAVLNLGTWGVMWWATYLATGIIMAGLGLLLGVGMLKTWFKDPAAQQRMDQLIERLAPKQGILGLVGIGLGAWSLVAYFLQ